MVNMMQTKQKDRATKSNLVKQGAGQVQACSHKEDLIYQFMRRTLAAQKVQAAERRRRIRKRLRVLIEALEATRVQAAVRSWIARAWLRTRQQGRKEEVTGAARRNDGAGAGAGGGRGGGRCVAKQGHDGPYRGGEGVQGRYAYPHNAGAGEAKGEEGAEAEGAEARGGCEAAGAG